jgi:ribosomal protein S18 acetylase RimI-like enzyme
VNLTYITKNDYLAVTDIIQHALLPNYRMGTVYASDNLSEFILDDIDRFPQNYIGIRVDNQIVALVQLKLTQNDLHINNIAVIPSFQGKSYGAYLLKHCLDIAKNHSLAVTLKVHSTNTVALNWYKKFGFIVLEQEHWSHYLQGFGKRLLSCCPQIHVLDTHAFTRYGISNVNINNSSEKLLAEAFLINNKQLKIKRLYGNIRELELCLEACCQHSLLYRHDDQTSVYDVPSLESWKILNLCYPCN